MYGLNIKDVERRHSFVDGLSEMAEFLENLEMIRADLLPKGFTGLVIFLWAEDLNELREYTKLLGNVEKFSDNTTFGVRRYFGPHRIEVSLSHETVCEKKIVQTIEHPARIIEAWTEEVYEWTCPPILPEAI